MQRLLGEVVAERMGSLVGGSVALVEDEVDHGQHARRPLVEAMRLGHAETDAGVRDLGPRPKQALPHRRLADEEGSCDLLGREPRDGLQRERNAPGHRQGRVAAGEQQAELVVVPRLLTRRQGRCSAFGERLELSQLVLLDPSALEHVERAVT